MYSTSSVGDEILRKKKQCLRNNYVLEAVFMNPTDLLILLTDSRFQDVSYYASNSMLPDSGEAGKIFGVKAIVSTNVLPHKLIYSVNMNGHFRIPRRSSHKTDKQVNPSRRDE